MGVLGWGGLGGLGVGCGWVFFGLGEGGVGWVGWWVVELLGWGYGQRRRLDLLAARVRALSLSLAHLTSERSGFARLLVPAVRSTDRMLRSPKS